MSLTDLHESAAIGREQAAIRPHFYADDSQLLAITSLSGVSDCLLYTSDAADE